MAVAKRPGREKPEKIGQRKEGPRTRERTSGKTNNTPGWPNLHKTGPGTEKHKRSQSSLRLLSHAMGRSSPPLFGSTCPHASKMDFPAII